MNFESIMRLRADIMMLNEKLIDEVCSEIKIYGSVTSCFGDEAVTFEIMVGSADRCLKVDIDLFEHIIYKVDYHDKSKKSILRWVNPNEKDYKEYFKKCQNDERIIYTTDYNLLTAVTAVIEDLERKNDDGNNECVDDDETIEVEMSDSELALIARAAHIKDITINDFINEAIIAMLDEDMPDWREEYKNGGL